MSRLEIVSVEELEEFFRASESRHADGSVASDKQGKSTANDHARVFRIDMVERVTSRFGRLMSRLGVGPDTDFDDTYLLIRVRTPRFVESDPVLGEIFSKATLVWDEATMERVRTHAQQHIDEANKGRLGPDETYLSRHFVLGSFSASGSEVPGFPTTSSQGPCTDPV